MQGVYIELPCDYYTMLTFMVCYHACVCLCMPKGEPVEVNEEVPHHSVQFSTPEPTPTSSKPFTWNSAKPLSRVVPLHDSSDQLAKGLNKELTCAICFGLFKTPKMLPCLHTFCEKCLKQIVAQSSKQSVKRDIKDIKF